MANKIQAVHKYRIIAEDPQGTSTYSHNFQAKQWRAVVKEARRFATPLPTGTRVYAYVKNQPGAVPTHIHTVTPQEKPRPDKAPADLSRVAFWLDEESERAWRDSHFPQKPEKAIPDIKIEPLRPLPVIEHVVKPKFESGAKTRTESPTESRTDTEPPAPADVELSVGEKLVEIMYESDKVVKAAEVKTSESKRPEKIKAMKEDLDRKIEQKIKVAGRGGGQTFVHVRNRNGATRPLHQIEAFGEDLDRGGSEDVFVAFDIPAKN